MKRLKLATISALFVLQSVPLFAQSQTLTIRGALSISTPISGDQSRMAASYSKSLSAVGMKWTLRLGGADPNTRFTLCASKDFNPGSCTSNFGQTDQYGNWTLSGTFDTSAIGSWTEWIVFSPGIISNRISFAVGTSASIGGTSMTLNGSASGLFHVGQAWVLSTQATPPFQLCGETNGIGVSCSDYKTVGINSLGVAKNTFTRSDIGGWTLWLLFADGTTSNRLPFTVDDGPLDDATCASGTIYPIGPNAGFTIFPRFLPDWNPTSEQRDYAVRPGYTGGYGNTLEYYGCGGGNQVWLQWAYAEFNSFAVRAPWGGRTDRGLRIGDTLTRFQALYPAAHHPLPDPDFPTLISFFPANLDVWDNGPLRVAFKNGLVSIIEVDWSPDFSGIPNYDQKDAPVASRVGPYDPANPWN